MTTHNTGNALGSSDARDLYDNAENFDNAINGSGLTWVDRRGVTRSTWQGAIEDSITAAELAANDGSSKIGHILNATSAVARTAQSKFRETISVTDFGAVGDGVTNNATAFAAARNYLASLSNPPRLVFPPGHYKYSASPNWAIQNASYTPLGDVLLECTGTGHAVILNGAGTTNGNIFNCRFGDGGRFRVAASPTGGHGIYFSSYHAGLISARVVGAGTSSSGYYGQFAVCSVFDIQVTPNGMPPSVELPGGAWLNNAKPQNGAYLTQLNSGELISYCTFPNPILEHCTVGGYFDHVFGSTVDGGTMESCDVGLFLTPNAFNNRIRNVDFEVNEDHDIYCEGWGNEFLFCDSENVITIDDGQNNTIHGGSHNSIYVSADATATKLQDFIYNRYGTGSITDLAGGLTFRRNLTDRITGQVTNLPTAFVDISPSGSPFIYENEYINDVDVIVREASPGTVSDISFIRPDSLGFISLGVSNGMFRLSHRDKLQVTYSGSAPVMKLVTR